MGTRAGLDDVEKRKFSTLQGLEVRPLGREEFHWCNFHTVFRIKIGKLLQKLKGGQTYKKRSHKLFAKKKNQEQ
jgi:hypothetical protein